MGLHLSQTFISVTLGLLTISSCSKSTEEPYDGLHSSFRRISSHYTLSRDPNEVQFYYFGNNTDLSAAKEIIYNDTKSLENSGFKPERKTVFITHGFRSNLSSDMPQTLKNAFLHANIQLKLNYNIIVVNWGALSTPLSSELTNLNAGLYNLVTPNVPIVAVRLADFILFLHDSKFLKLHNVHLIGHSLGSHVSGLAGRHIFLATSQKVPRITGLDPAGPDFYPPDRTRNLMKEDATFVDVIHTNAGVLGDQTNDGHADFYPNGGTLQPGCLPGDIRSPSTIGRCSHWYAYQLYAASISETFWACPCRSALVSSMLGLCRPTCEDPIPMGFQVPTSAFGEYYLKSPNLLYIISS